MEKLKIPMGEYKVSAYAKKIPIKHIFFDEDNPRISLAKDSERSNSGKSLTQEDLHFVLMTNPSYASLRRSIYEGRGAMVPIWVMKGKKENSYLVIEGNTRLAIYRELFDTENNPDFEEINCWVLDLSIDKVNDEIKDFIRLTCHLQGVTEWDKYEQAKYLYILYNNKQYPIKTLSNRTKLTPYEIYQDIKAYKIMTDQFLTKFQDDPSNVHKYSYFKEYVKDKKLLAVMEKNNYTDSDFSDWVGSGKFDKAVDVRKLKDVLSNQMAREKFIEKDFDRAMDILKDIIPEKSDKLYKLINDIIDRLGNDVGLDELEELRNSKSKKRKILLDLRDKINKILGLK